MEMTLGKIKDLLEKGNETSRSQKRWFVTWRGGIFSFGAHRCSHPLEIWCWSQGATELLLATLQQLLQKSHLDFTDLEGEQSLALFPLLCALCVKKDIFIGSILRKTLSKKKHNICHWCKNTQRWRILEHELLGQVSWRDIPRVHHEEHADQGCILQSALLIYEEKQEVTCH